MNGNRGFSMVELMVAITLALVVTAGVLSVFVGSRSAFQATGGVAALSDSGRFALSTIQNAVRGSGFMACGAATRTVSNVNPEPTSLYFAPGASGLFQPLGGYEATNTSGAGAYTAGVTAGALGNWTPSLDAAFSTLPALPIKNNDVLVVRSSSAFPPVYVTAVGTDNFTVTAPAANEFSIGQLAIVSDCTKSLLMQVSNIQPSAPGQILFHTQGAGAGANITSTLPSWVTFAPGAQITPLETTVYYIGLGTDGDGALYSADVNTANSLNWTTAAAASPNELVPDVEAMQILYGVDTVGTQTVTSYVPADKVTDFTTVMSVQVAVLAAGPLGSAKRPTTARTFNLLGTTVTAPLDTRARQVFQVTIAARNAVP